MKLWVTVALITLMTASAYPREARAEMTGAELLEICAAGEVEATGDGSIRNAYDYGQCNGFIRGSIAGLISGIPRFNRKISFCLLDVTVGDERRVIMAYIKSKPNIADDLAVDLIEAALTEVWNRESIEWSCQAQPSTSTFGDE